MIAKVSAVVLAAASAVYAAGTPACPTLAGQLSGNPIFTPDITHTPTIGEAYTVSWDPTGLSDTVSFILLRGPGTNIVPIGVIATGVKNSGSFSWTPDCSLEPDTTHYGLQMVDDVSCSFQYTTQFGLNAGTTCGTTPPKSSSSESAPPSSSTSSAPPTKESSTSKYPGGHHSYSTDCTETETATVTIRTHKPSGSAVGGTGSYPTGGYGGNGTTGYGASPTGPAGGAPGASGTYKPALSNDAGRFTTMSFSGAVIALGAAALLL